jgi:hypothetical protein
MEIHLETIEAKAFRTFFQSYFLFRSRRLSAIPVPSGNLQQTPIFETESPAKQGSPYHLLYRKAHSGMQFKYDFQNSVSVLFHHTIMQAGNRSHKKSESKYSQHGTRRNSTKKIRCVRGLNLTTVKPTIIQVIKLIRLRYNIICCRKSELTEALYILYILNDLRRNYFSKYGKNMT